MVSANDVSSSTTTMNVNVVIVGGGASGLQCAASLLKNDANSDNNDQPSLVILEARNRLGGRVYTTQETRFEAIDSSPSSLQGQQQKKVTFNRDHGAAWVHGTGYKEDKDGRNPIVNLLQEMTLDGKDAVETHLIPIFHGNPWTRPDTIVNKTKTIAIYVNGKELSEDATIIDEAVQRHYERKKEQALMINKMYESGEGMKVKTISVDEINRRFIEQARDASNEPSAQVENEQLLQQIVPFFEFFYANWLGISTSEIPAEEYLLDDDDDDDENIGGNNTTRGTQKTDEEYTPVGDYKGSHCKVKAGMAEALRPLISKVEKYVKLGEPVTKIQDNGDNVLVETFSGRQVVADCCVCTIPLGCLQQGDIFEPPLGAERLEAARSIFSGAYKKVFLTFDRIFWPKKKPWIGLIRSNPSVNVELGKYLLINNLYAKNDIPCFEAILFGDPGKWAFEKSDKIIQNAVIGFIEDAMGLSDVSSWCVDCHVTRWEEDPFSRGSYSTFRMGSLVSHIDLLRTSEWDGRLIFCGEHTQLEHLGSVHAALMSGEQAAGKAMNLLSRAGR